MYGGDYGAPIRESPFCFGGDDEAVMGRLRGRYLVTTAAEAAPPHSAGSPQPSGGHAPPSWPPWPGGQHVSSTANHSAARVRSSERRSVQVRPPASIPSHFHPTTRPLLPPFLVAPFSKWLPSLC